MILTRLNIHSLGSSCRTALEQAVHLVHDPTVFGVSTLSTKYPSDHPVSELADHIIAGPEYYAPCDADTGSLLYLGLTVSQTWRNVLHSDSKNATVSIASSPDPAVPDPRHSSERGQNNWKHGRPSWRRGMPSKSRITLFGHFTLLNATEHPGQAEKALRCYLDHHPDASHWAPNSTDSPHIPFWATFHVDRVYWVGGFGDEHYIGWFSKEEWSAAWKEHRPAVQTWASEDAYASTVDGLQRPFAVKFPFSPSLEATADPDNDASHPTLAFQ